MIKVSMRKVSGYLKVNRPEKRFRNAVRKCCAKGRAAAAGAVDAEGLGLIACWIAVMRSAALSGLARKLPHYGKYGYLGFEGDAPDNVLKGIFPTFNSILNYSIQYDGKILPVTSKIVPRKALSNKK